MLSSGRANHCVKKPPARDTSVLPANCVYAICGPMIAARQATAAVFGSVSICVQNRLSAASGHGKRLINQIDLTHKEFDHDHSEQA